MAYMTFRFTESVVEEACLEYFGRLGYASPPAPEIACDGLFTRLRQDYGAGRERCRVRR